jgi:hypothetical protein
MGPRKSIVAVAGIWALWHVPFVLSGVPHLARVPVLSAALILPLGDLGAGMGSDGCGFEPRAFGSFASLTAP